MIHLISHNFQWGQRKSGLDRSFDLFLKLAAANLNTFSHLQIPLEISPPLSRPEIDSTGLLDLMTRHFFHRSLQSCLEALENSPQSLLLNWGGDHSVGLSTGLGFLQKYPQGQILWVDAHADLNTPTSSITKNFHGMPVAYALNLEGLGKLNFPHIKHFLKPEQIIYLGLRDLDPQELDTLNKYQIRHFDMKSIRSRGLATILNEISPQRGPRELHVSFDVDVVDPSLIPSTGVPADSGLILDELLLLADWIRNSNKLKSLDIVELNPEIGSPSEVAQSYRTIFQFLNRALPQVSHFSTNINFERHQSINHLTKEPHVRVC